MSREIPWRVLLSVANEPLRERLVDALSVHEFTVYVLDNPWLLHPWHRYYIGVCCTDIVVIETGNDMACLVQVVYELYRGLRPTHTLPIVGIVSRAAIARNPSLSNWETGDHPALWLLIPKEDIGIERLAQELRQLVEGSIKL